MPSSTLNDVVYNLKSLKRTLKTVPEYGRVALGSAAFKRNAPNANSLGKSCAAPRRLYRDGATRGPVHIVTPPDGHYMTTFFDVEPISPSGRYLAVTRVPFIWRIPREGDPAEIVVIDLDEQVATPVYSTSGWGAQLGANVQWGKDDSTLFFNDVVGGRPAGIRLDWQKGNSVVLGGTIYGLSPDKKFSLSGRLDYINAGIPGYGVPERLIRRNRQPVPENHDDGIWRTDLETGETELFLSVRDIVSALPEQESLKGSTYYIFNIKVNRQGTRGFVVLFTRNTPRRAGWPPQLATFDIDGTNIQLAMPDRLWRVGGHHPSWLPDGDQILMNLRRTQGAPLEFVRFGWDGGGLETVAEGNIGGGHPSVNPSSTHLITDAYVSEIFRDGNGDVPIRCIDLRTNVDEPLARVFTGRRDGFRRVDPHPVWSGKGDRVVFNGLVDGKRQVMIADTSFLERD